ncbi:MAG: hypothetical protein ACKVWV_12010 [Planctomycetota bacterium]
MSAARWLAVAAVLALGVLGLWLGLPKAAPLAPAVESDAVAHSSREPAAALELLDSVADPVRPHDSREHAIESARSEATTAREARSRPERAVSATRPEDFVTVTVRYQSGAPCVGAAVRLEAASVGEQPPRFAAWAVDRRTDSNGRARFDRDELRITPRVVIHAQAEPGFASRETVFAGRAAVPSEIDLVLERTNVLRVQVRTQLGGELDRPTIVVATIDDHAPLIRERVTPERGRITAFALAPGTYEVSAFLESIGARAQERITVRGDQSLVLTLAVEPSAPAPLAVAGIVLDEQGKGVAGVPVSVLSRRWQSAEQNARAKRSGGVTDARGVFEVRAEPSDELEVSVADDPFVATYAPSDARVAHGTEGLVFRRTRSWMPQKIRVHAVDSITNLTLGEVSFSMRELPHGKAQRIFRGRDGWIDAAVPPRDDLGWTVDAVGHHAVEGRVADLLALVRDGVLQVTLARDPKELEALAKEGSDAAGAPTARRRH